MTNYQFNTAQSGEAYELLTSLAPHSVSLVFLDPQYEKASNISRVKSWPLPYQTDQQINQILKEIARVLKPSAFALLWVNKKILSTNQVWLWLRRATNLKIVDFLVWAKPHFGFGSYFRSQAEYAFLLQKLPLNSQLFSNRSLASVWTEKLAPNKQHPHQKPSELIKTLILATTQEQDLVVDPCAGSFVVLVACQATNRHFLGCDLTYQQLQEFNLTKSPLANLTDNL